jgi:hypothetical protein
VFVPLNAGALQFLETPPHTDAAAAAGLTWDEAQVGVLDGVALTLLGGDLCGPAGCATNATAGPRTDGVVPLYSQLMQPCETVPCGPPPDSVYIPSGMVPAGTVRATFPTVHSTFTSGQAGLPKTDAVSNNPDAISFLVATVTGHWRAAGARLMPTEG